MSAVTAEPLLVGFDALAGAILLLLLGWLVADALLAPCRVPPWLRAGLSLAGIALFALVLQCLHVITGGLVFSHLWVVRGLVAATVLVLGARRIRSHRDDPMPSPRDLAGALAVVGLGWLVWGYPVWRVTPAIFSGDAIMHSAWTAQLLNGETTPTAAITGAVPNYYPWLFHAALAVATSLAPTGRAPFGLAPLQLALTGGILLALYALGRELGGRSRHGACVALTAGLTGGFGYFLSRMTPALVYRPRGHETHFWGDFLFVRSYDPSFYQLTPPFPRDLAFGLLVCAVTLTICGLRRRDKRLLLGSGVLVGLAGLTNAESFLVGVGLLIVVGVLPPGIRRRDAALWLLLPMFAVYCLWLIPQAIAFVELGGYVNLTKVGPVTMPAWAILFGWGIITPLAAVGVARYLPRARGEPGARVLLYLTVVAGASIALCSLIPLVLGHAFTTLARAHRYWPLLGFALAVYAGLGLAWITETLRRPRWAAAVVLGLAVLLALPSPMLASLKLPTVATHLLMTDAAARRPHALLNLIAEDPGRCVVAVPPTIEGTVWSYTGCRMVLFAVTALAPSNQARIRFRDIYRRVTPVPRRIKDNWALVLGNVSRARWQRIACRYDVNAVVAPNSVASLEPGFPPDGVPASDAPYTVFYPRPCPG